MTFLITVCLIALGAVLGVVGLITGSSWAFLGAALCSAGAIVVLWKAAGKAREQSFVTSVPILLDQQWHQLLPQDDEKTARVELSREELFPVAIDGYADLVASEIVPSLETMSVEQLKAIILRERQGLARPIIISRAEKLIDLTLGAEPDSLDIREGHAHQQRRPDDGLSI